MTKALRSSGFARTGADYTAWVRGFFPAFRRQWQLGRRRAYLVRVLGVSHVFRRRRNDRRYQQQGRRGEEVTRALWTDAAHELGAEMLELSPEIFEFRLGSAVARVLGQKTPLADPVATELASDKPLAYRILSRAGLPVPEHIVVDARDAAAAGAFLETGPLPCVVKPARGAGGEGVVGSVRTVSQLRRAMLRASARCSELIVERQIAGDHFRLLFLDGELLDVIRRVRPRVTGDGRSTIEELMFREYERRLDSEGADALWPFAIGLDCLFTLDEQGLGPRSVLPDGAAAAVMCATNLGGRDDAETFRSKLSPALEDDARAACTALGVRLGGVDVITSKPDRSLAAGGGAVLEVNPIPGLVHHYRVAAPANATRVAIPILRALLAAGEAGARPRLYRRENSLGSRADSERDASAESKPT